MTLKGSRTRDKPTDLRTDPPRPLAGVDAAQPTVPPFVVLNADLARLESDYANSIAAVHTRATVALAWQLRQRDSARAERLVAEARADLSQRRPDDVAAAAQAARLQLIDAEVAWLFARADEADPALRDALREAEALDDRALAADAHWLGAQVAYDRGETSRCNASLTLCAASARAAGDLQRESFAKAAMARWSVLTDPEGVREIWLPAFPVGSDGYPAGVATWVDDFHATLAYAQGDFGKSLVHRLRAHHHAQGSGQLKRALLAQANIAGAFGNLNDNDSAFQWGERYLDEARRLGWPASIALGLVAMGAYLRGIRRYDAACDVLLEALGMSALGQASRERSLALDYLGDCLEKRGEAAPAIELYREMASIAGTLKQPDMLFAAQAGQARALAAMGQVDSAIELSRATLAASRETHKRPNLEIQLLLALSLLHGRRRDEGRADPVSEGRAALACIEEALSVAHAMEGHEAGDHLYTQLAMEQARAGDHRAAFDSALEAARAREKTLSKEAVDRSIALQISHETERSRAEAEHHRALAATLRQTNETLQTLGDIGQEITRHLDEGAVFDVLRSEVDGLLDSQHLSIFLVRDDPSSESSSTAPGLTLVLSLAFGVEDGQPMAEALSIALDDPTSGVARCARQRQEIVWNRGPAETGDEGHVPGTLRTSSALYAPLQIGGRLLGVMTVQAVRVDAYGEREQLIFRTLCAYGAIGLDNARAYRRQTATSQALQAARDVLAQTNLELERAYQHQQEASLTDPLTGLRNRRFLTERMEEDAALARRRAENGAARNAAAMEVHAVQGPVFFMIDVDHFKSVNDQHGHAAGDQVLVQMAQRLHDVVRTTDHLVRWGGEEFLVVARDVDPSQAAILAERLRVGAGGRPFDIGGGESLSRTVSIGFAAYPFHKDPRRLSNWAALVDLADQALYRAKHGGRDRWVGLSATEVASSRARFELLSRDPRAALADGTLTLMEGDAGTPGQPSTAHP